ncbi:3-hydroxyacyl-CoA dehydrogenase [Burkholderia sp. D7]|nr:3-hydroxyacyl-CoA dehydrogenase [Burkholderia sp. D7]
MQQDSDYVISDGVAILTLNNPPVNSLSAAQRATLRSQMLHASKRDDVKAIVLIGTGSAFCGGAEIKEFNTPAQAALPRMPELIEGCDGIDKLLIAAIDGFAFGAGLELALAFHYRVATPGARLGLPEIKFGFLPGAGGTQRLPRLVPMPRAAEMMLSGESVTAGEGFALGLIDDVVEGDLRSAAVNFALGLIERGVPKRRTRDLPARLDGASAGFFEELRASVTKRSQGNVAKLHIVDCCVAATEKPFDEALSFERERFLEMLGTPESKALRHVFFAERQAAKLAHVSAEVRPRAIRRAAVVGAGTMGAGIAMCFANAGIPVVLIDAKPEGLERGRTTIEKTYRASVAKGRLTQDQMDRVIDLIEPSLDLSAAADTDIVVEAVFEDIDIKQNIFRQLDALLRPGVILATNTSMLDINVIANVTSRPQDVIGMHFFSPAHVMRLVEVVRCSVTSDDVLVSVMQLARKLGRTPVMSGVCDGFIGNRMLQKYGQQSLFLLDEGCTPQQIDRALQKWGMAMGPFAVGDLSGLDIGWSIRKRRYVENPEMVYSRIADRVCEAGRLGQKTGKGWYRYESGNRTPQPDPEVDAILASYRAEADMPQRVISDEEIVGRMIFALVSEGAAILEEGIAQRASDIDVVYTTGYGFPSTRGGPMYYANTLGLDKVLASIHEFQQGYQGGQWKPSALLVELAAQGKQFS